MADSAGLTRESRWRQVVERIGYFEDSSHIQLLTHVRAEPGLGLPVEGSCVTLNSLVGILCVFTIILHYT